MRRAALVAFLLVAGGCPGNDLRGRTSGIKDVIRQARENGAYKCAPHELAMAESHLEFASAELDDGHYFPAKQEVALAEDNAKRAYALSPKEQCNPPPPPPKPVDSDGDGIPDKIDKCPHDPEDKDGFEDEDGCPDPDNDKDGIADGDDKCPLEPGPKENGGCPDKDKDGDTVVDRLDKCPDVPGPPDNDGCPKPKFIVVTKEKIELKQKVHFATNKSTIYPDSFPMLTEVANVLKARPEVKVRIEGHTDSRGTMAHNMKLSQARAESVRQFLVNQGVDLARMEAQGFGPTQPIDDNRTAKGRENNRRTEFIITSQ
jgi:OOP family OmpA-OmpF porin